MAHRGGAANTRDAAGYDDSFALEGAHGATTVEDRPDEEWIGIVASAVPARVSAHARAYSQRVVRTPRR
jgi:hypothetical protein